MVRASVDDNSLRAVVTERRELEIDRIDGNANGLFAKISDLADVFGPGPLSGPPPGAP